jgi:cell division protein YceG involved in septum cleavage
MARVAAAILVLLLLAGLAAGAAGWWAWQQLDTPGPAREAVVFEVPPGMSLARIASRLEEAGALRHAKLFRMVRARLRHWQGRCGPGNIASRPRARRGRSWPDSSAER